LWFLDPIGRCIIAGGRRLKMDVSLIGLSRLVLLVGQLIHGRVQAAPHHGKVVRLGEQRLELRVQQSGVEAWLLDRKLHTRPVAGRILRLTLTPKGQASQTVVMIGGRDHFRGVVALPELSEMSVTAELDGRGGAHAEFPWIVDEADRAADGDPLEGLKL
jgi:hypothetical protein